MRVTKTGNFLVTGASGFLGSAVAKALSEEQVDFYAMQHRRAVDPLPGMTVLQGGTRTLDAALLDCYDIDAVIHCARPTAPRFRQFGRRWAAWRAARDNAFLVREVTGSGQQRRLVFASGSLVYGSSSTPHGEDAPVRPLSYAREYHAGEIPLEQAVRAGKAVMILRFPWILGNGSWFRWFYLVPSLAALATRTFPLTASHIPK